MGMMFRYLKNYKKEAILGPLFKFLEALFELIVPLVMAKIIDVGIKNSDTSYILKMGGVLVLLGVVGLISSLTCQYMASKASQSCGTRIRNDLFEKINSLSFTEIDRIKTSSLITRMTTDANQVQQGIAMLIRLAVRAPFLIIGATVMSFYINPQLALIFLVATLLISLVLFIIMNRSIPFYKVNQKKLDKVTRITRENLTGVRVIRAFSKQDDEKKRFFEATMDFKKASISISRISALLSPIVQIIINVAIILVIWFGAKKIDLGALTQGELIALVNYLTQIMLALIAFADLIVIFTKVQASSARIDEVLNLTSSIIENGTDEEITNDLIVFNDVSFRFDKSNVNALSNINFTIKKGETLGIIGGTGSGKSTIANLINRFYDVTEGKISIFGKDIKDYRNDDLRSIIGFVPQKAQLFKGTIRENMQFRKENASDDEIYEALDISQSMEILNNIKDDLDYEIKEGAKNLSGGQKQRLSIARALVGRPDIVILDDSSSALDYLTDKKLRHAIKEKIENAAVIIISQRATSIKYADKILVLDGGKEVGLGTHEELLRTCDVYQEIFYSQTAKKDGEKR